MAPSELVRAQEQFLVELAERVAALATEEAQLHASMDPNVARIMRGKNILAFIEAAHMLGHDDADLLRDMSRGFPVVGTISGSREFSQLDRPAIATVEELIEGAHEAQTSARQAARPSGDPEIDQGVYEASLADVFRVDSHYVFNEASLGDVFRVVSHYVFNEASLGYVFRVVSHYVFNEASLGLRF